MTKNTVNERERMCVTRVCRRFPKKTGACSRDLTQSSTPTRVQFPGCLILSDRSSPSRVRSSAPTARPLLLRAVLNKDTCSHEGIAHLELPKVTIWRAPRNHVSRLV